MRNLTRYRGQQNWPPVWTSMGKGENRLVGGEVGTLKEVRVAAAEPKQNEDVKPSRLYLFMNYRNSAYVGCVLFDDASACRQVGRVLLDQRGRTLHEIGQIDLSHLL
ncbi:MAG TPA: hypothetical protein VHL99_01710 [Candidatus Binatia bacterium]|jgi:hypothetical protein|nr:hypothetical protein [Candidatus Binatia bacterium]